MTQLLKRLRVEICQTDLHRWVCFCFEIAAFPMLPAVGNRLFFLLLQSSMWSISALWGLSIIAMYLVLCVRKQE